jgi:hypothetical protein
MSVKKKDTKKTISKKTLDNAKRIHFLALVLGYNDLAKQATVLGDRVWYRLARENAVKQLCEAGGDIDIKYDNVILTLYEYPVRLAFTAADIELMRKCIADFDEVNKPEPSNKEELCDGNGWVNTGDPMRNERCNGCVRCVPSKEALDWSPPEEDT